MANGKEDSYIDTRDGGRTEEFEPRPLQNNREWVGRMEEAPLIYVNVRTPAGGSEYRPLARFTRLPPLGTILLYASNSRDSLLDQNDPRVVEAIRAQHQAGAVAGPVAGRNPGVSKQAFED